MFEQLAGYHRDTDVYQAPPTEGATEPSRRPMTKDELRAELERREELLRQPPPNAAEEDREGETDQWRIYKDVTRVLERNAAPARFIIQASAGAGKSFLLETLYLWCAVHGHKAEACAPTGIAAARIHVPRTPVRASTLHHLFGLRGDMETTIDMTRNDDEGAKRLRSLTVLFQDEFSMADDEIWRQERSLLGPMADLAQADDPAGHETDEGSTEEDERPAETTNDTGPAQTETTPGRRRVKHPRSDDFGRTHMLIFVDFKQLPPATGRPPFIAGDPMIWRNFEFRVLRQNRRVAGAGEGGAEKQTELDEFHKILGDIAHGRETPRVRKFVVEAYVRGAEPQNASAREVPFE